MYCDLFNFQSIADELSLRSDATYICNDISNKSEEYYFFSDLFSFVNYENIDTSLFINIKYVEIGCITSTGDVSPVFLDFDDRNELNEKYFKKIEKGDIIAVNTNDILISKVRPYLKKILLIDTSNNSYYYTSAFIKIHPKKHPKLLYYSLKTVFNQVLNSISRQGKGYPTLNEKDFYLLKFNKKKVDRLFSNSVLLEQKIKAIEKKIVKLKQKITSDEDIINSVIVDTFHFNIKELHRLDDLSFLSLDFKELSESSLELRDSVRFTKMRLLQQEMMRHYDDCTTLEEYLLSPMTKNGWSPENNELEGDTKLLGIDSLHFNGVLTTDNPKFTNETRVDIDNYFVNNGDFFVSRGNTVDLVALASIAENIEEDLLYPDLMIKLFVDETKIDKYFLVYLFNSIIGRLYFKYASKGKQQTMVKVSSDTIRNFVIPKITLNKQREIVKKIRKSSNEQNKLRKQIKDLRDEIDSIIEISMNTD